MLTSLQNPLVKTLRKLHRAKERRDQQRFLLEGTHLIEEACAVAYPLEVVCCTPEWQTRYPQLWERLLDQSERVELVSPEIVKAIATTVEPDGIVAAAPHQIRNPPPDDIQLGVALETIQDPGNLGTVIRTAAAAGVDGIWVSDDSVDLEHPKVLRATAGQWFRLPMAVSTNLAADIERFRASGVQVVATLADAEQVYWDVDFTRPTLVLLGNEGAGLSKPLTAKADVQTRIPLAAGVESLNVAIAASLILYEAIRQRQAKG
jgi:RNA methyltransferase, TrmH family